MLAPPPNVPLHRYPVSCTHWLVQHTTITYLSIPYAGHKNTRRMRSRMFFPPWNTQGDSHVDSSSLAARVHQSLWQRQREEFPCIENNRSGQKNRNIRPNKCMIYWYYNDMKYDKVPTINIRQHSRPTIDGLGNELVLIKIPNWKKIWELRAGCLNNGPLLGLIICRLLK